MSTLNTPHISSRGITIWDLIFRKYANGTITRYEINTYNILHYDDVISFLVNLHDDGKISFEELKSCMTEEDRQLWKGYLLGKRLDLV